MNISFNSKKEYFRLCVGMGSLFKKLFMQIDNQCFMTKLKLVLISAL